jgi:uncharacterized NAD(P)/FAD-binding protein YdhS
MQPERSRRPDRIRDVVIVGGGASGVLVASRLLTAADGGRVLLVDAGGGFGRGVAYGTGDSGHLLNVRVRNMSASSDAPDDLAHWCARKGIDATLDDYLPRRDYGDYLAEHLDAAEASARGGLERVVDEVRSVARVGDGFAVGFASGRVASARFVVLALGNLPPATPRFLDHRLADHPAWVADPWAPHALARIADGAAPLLIGTGLTATDVALTTTRDSTASIDAISRHGLLPRVHRAVRSACPPVPSEFSVLDDLSAGGLVRTLRRAIAGREADGGHWQEVVDGLRPVTNPIWLRMAEPDRRRLVTRLATFWSVHRHRTAPAIGARLAELRAADRLRIHAGRIVAVEAEGALLAVRADVGGVVRSFRTDRLVNCTGPSTDWIGRGGCLTRDLGRDGLIRPDPLGLGLDTTPAGQLIGADGRPTPGLFTIGPPRRGTLWESTAIPEIRGQAEALAQHLSSTRCTR